MMELLIRSPLFLAIILVLVIGEAIWRTRIARKSYDRAGAAASFAVAAGNFALKPITGALIGAAFLAVHEVTPLRLPIDDWRVWLLAFVAVEFAYYWLHRWSHTVRWLWASHAVHHSASEMTFPAAIRLGWTSALSGGWIVFLPLIAAGFHPLMVSTLLGANLVYQFFLHTELVGRLGLLEWVFNTPSHHRAHHASNPEYIDCNFGGVVIVFDRMFGTFVEERDDAALQYGLVHPLQSRNPFIIAIHEWSRMAKDVRSARSMHDLWSAFFGRPA